MNYYFFLDPRIEGLDSSVELFNRAPTNILKTNKLKTKKILAFYSDGSEWKYEEVGTLKPYENKTVKKSNLSKHFQKQNVFISLFDNYKERTSHLIFEDYMKSLPEWRSNLKISSYTSSCSYQGEYPYNMAKRKLSIVSCSPMIQSNSGINSYFCLVNLNNDPKINNFELEILNPDKVKIDSVKMQSNSINFYKLDRDIVHPYKFLIFTCKTNGGIPIYFSLDDEKKMLSIEHTHPPTSYFAFGNAMYFQSNKKKYWFK